MKTSENDQKYLSKLLASKDQFSAAELGDLLTYLNLAVMDKKEYESKVQLIKNPHPCEKSEFKTIIRLISELSRDLNDAEQMIDFVDWINGQILLKRSMHPAFRENALQIEGITEHALTSMWLHMAQLSVIAARQSIEFNEFDQAIECLCSAKLSAGGALMRLSTAQKIAEEALKINARLGGEKRSEKYQKLKEYAQKIATERAPNGRWPSQRQAAKAIKFELKSFAQQHNIPPLSEDQAETTICGWLRDMPDKDLLFASKRRTSTSKGNTSTS